MVSRQPDDARHIRLSPECAHGLDLLKNSDSAQVEAAILGIGGLEMRPLTEGADRVLTFLITELFTRSGLAEWTSLNATDRWDYFDFVPPSHWSTHGWSSADPNGYWGSRPFVDVEETASSIAARASSRTAVVDAVSLVGMLEPRCGLSGTPTEVERQAHAGLRSGFERLCLAVLTRWVDREVIPELRD